MLHRILNVETKVAAENPHPIAVDTPQYRFLVVRGVETDSGHWLMVLS